MSKVNDYIKNYGFRDYNWGKKTSVGTTPYDVQKEKKSKKFWFNKRSNRKFKYNLAKK